MASATITVPTLETAADVLQYFSYIPPHRIRLIPPPGTATEQDVINAAGARQKRLCELVDGTLLEKPIGYYESLLAGLLIRYLWEYLDGHDLGIVLAPDGMVRVVGRVRMPDVSFISWDRLPARDELPAEAILGIVPDLAVEILSESNTKEEMDRKLREYFKASTRLVWYIDAEARTVEVYTGPRRPRLLHEADTLEGGAVLPGFRLPLRKLFAVRRRRRR